MKIKFIASSKQHFESFDPPVPTQKILPKWYKNQGKYINGKFKIADNGNPSHTIKGCMPVFDMLSAGYTVTMPADAYFTLKEDGSYSIQWSVDTVKLIEHHEIVQYDKITIPEGFNPIALKFVQPWIIKTPPGYSCLFIHPTYNFDLPFYVLPAIVDTDKHPIPINFPFFLKDGFEGMIEMGTPIMQIIPFKRDDWKSEISYSKDGISFEGAKRKIINRYKTFFRTIKRWD